MGNYNPHAPIIVGNEWVPIRQADYIPDQVTERGYTFTLEHATAVVSGSYYTKIGAPTYEVAQTISVYPEGTEDRTGPVHSLIIPCNSVAATGTGPFIDGLPTSPSGGGGFVFVGNNGSAQVGVSFDVGAYAQALAGKRILNLSFDYLASGSQESLAKGQFELRKLIDSGGGLIYQVGLDGFATTGSQDIQTLNASNVNPWWAPGVNGINNPNQTRAYPWRYDELLNFSTAATVNRMVAIISADLSVVADNLSISYFAMRVTYCEEQRVLYGADLLHVSGFGNNLYANGTGKLVQLRTPALALPTTLVAGNYTVTNSYSEFARSSLPRVAAPMRAVRELYQLPNQRGVILNQTNVVDAEFTVDDSDVIPHITLHTASGIVTGSHAYGTTIAAPVYGSTTAIQEVEDDAAGSSRVYPQVRFYARRFGDTTVALRLIDVATGVSSASITVADFDALPEIVDGWREVTLRFTSPPTFAPAAGDVDWRWDSVGELAGNQWQILGADGPAISGTQTTGPATYYAPNGSTIALNWQSPVISGSAEDSVSDATLIFSTDPPIVSGFALVTASQTVTGALDCSLLPACIVTGIGYVQLSWTSVAVTGSLELQRSDTVDTGWNTILLTATTTATGFADYEARVGVPTSYRIRSLNVLDFAGSWSTISGTLTAPGVFGAGDANSVLIFTSNFGPTGNLAYTMQFQGQAVEEFVFSEADRVVFQHMYGRNFPVAFHPLEREGEKFTRSILVNAAAIPVPSLGNFRGLRDLAWADRPYVCVRDELGNRWFANVRVPSGSIQQDRSIYMAQIEVTEVSDVPEAVT